MGLILTALSVFLRRVSPQLLVATFLYAGVALLCAGILSLVAKYQKPVQDRTVYPLPDDTITPYLPVAYHAIKFFLSFCLGVSSLVFYFVSSALVPALAAKITATVGIACIFCPVFFVYYQSLRKSIPYPQGLYERLFNHGISYPAAVWLLALGVAPFLVYLWFPTWASTLPTSIIGSVACLFIFGSVSILFGHMEAQVGVKCAIIGILFLGIFTTAFYVISTQSAPIVLYAGLSLIICAWLSYCLKAYNYDAHGALGGLGVYAITISVLLVGSIFAITFALTAGSGTFDFAPWVRWLLLGIGTGVILLTVFAVILVARRHVKHVERGHESSDLRENSSSQYDNKFDILQGKYVKKPQGSRKSDHVKQSYSEYDINDILNKYNLYESPDLKYNNDIEHNNTNMVHSSDNLNQDDQIVAIPRRSQSLSTTNSSGNDTDLRYRKKFSMDITKDDIPKDPTESKIMLWYVILCPVRGSYVDECFVHYMQLVIRDLKKKKADLTPYNILIKLFEYAFEWQDDDVNVILSNASVEYKTFEKFLNYMDTCDENLTLLLKKAGITEQEAEGIFGFDIESGTYDQLMLCCKNLERLQVAYKAILYEELVNKQKGVPSNLLLAMSNVPKNEVENLQKSHQTLVESNGI